MWHKHPISWMIFVMQLALMLFPILLLLQTTVVKGQKLNSISITIMVSFLLFVWHFNTNSFFFFFQTVLEASITVDSVQCNANGINPDLSSNGVATAQVTGGQLPYTYHFANLDFK